MIRPRPNQRCYLHLWCRFIVPCLSRDAAAQPAQDHPGPLQQAPLLFRPCISWARAGINFFSISNRWKTSPWLGSRVEFFCPGRTTWMIKKKMPDTACIALIVIIIMASQIYKLRNATKGLVWRMPYSGLPSVGRGPYNENDFLFHKENNKTHTVSEDLNLLNYWLNFVYQRVDWTPFCS